MPPSKSEYEVERIVSDKYLVGRRFFFVKWRGFDSANNTWEPEENLANCPRLVREYFGGKGLRNTKSRNISSTLMRSMKVSETRRSSILALTSPKASLRGSRRSSVDSQAANANNSDNSQPTEAKFQLANIDKLHSAEAHDMQPADTSDLQPAETDNIQPAEVSNLESADANNLQPAEVNNLQTAEANNLQNAEANDLQTAEANDLQITEANDLHTAEANYLQLTEATDSQPTEANVCDATPSDTETEPCAQKVAALLLPPQQSVDQTGNINASVASSSEKQPNKNLEGGKLLSSMGLTSVVPKIELVRIEDDASNQLFGEFDIKKVELMRLGFVVTKRSPNSLVDLNKAKVRVSQRTRRPTPYLKQFSDWPRMSRHSRDKKPVLRQCFSVVDLTTDSLSSPDETGFTSSQLLSDNDCSWQNSTIVDHKFPNKLQVRLFDQTPRPEVLASVPFLENFESDTEPMSEWVNEDSDKENVTKKSRGRPAKGSSGRRAPTKKPRASNCDRRVRASRTRRSEMLAAAEVPPKELPKTDDAMVLLTEQNRVGGSNLVMFFPRLKLIKSIPEKMADKYYSQAVIDYYRRSMQPQVKVARRSF